MTLTFVRTSELIGANWAEFGMEAARGARKNERSEGRKDTRVGSYDNDKQAPAVRLEG
jgi:hypothetical protein